MTRDIDLQGAPASAAEATALQGTMLGQTPSGPQRRKRTITESRREQNRDAQKRFRQKRKEHLQKIRDEKKHAASRRVELRPRLQPEAAIAAPVLTPGSPSNSLSSLSDGPFGATSQALEPDIPVSFYSGEDDLNDASWAPDSEPQSLATLSSHQIPGLTAAPPKNNTWALTNRQGAGLSDPWANAIEFVQTTIFSAVLQNAVCLGFDLTQLAECALTYMSPFFRPDARPQDDPAKLLELCSTSLSFPPGTGCSAMPPNLRPTLTQFLVPHHVSFDLIPIPLLRDRAIMLSVAMPHLFNVTELKIDIYQNGGLMVWKHNGGGSHADKTFPPWDMKSWEAAPWFIKKWSMAVDGDGGELSKQSSSWQSLRRSQLLWLQLLQP